MTTFVSDYVRDLRAAIVVRRQSTTPHAAMLVVVVNVLVIAYIAAAIVMVPAGELPEFNFVDERGAITALSAVFLAMGSGFALAAFLTSIDHPARYRLFWLTAGLVIGFMAIDELLEFHERLGGRLDQIETLRAMVDQTPIRNWNDVIVIGYGVLAIPAAVYFLPSLMRVPRVFEFLCLAFIFFTIHTVTDSVVEPPTTLSVIIEESAKLLCTAWIAVALLIGLLGHMQPGKSS